MELSEEMLKDGLKFIVGTWQVDFIVNMFSNDLAHIPATEFKSDDGKDFSSIKFTFFEDHSLKMKDDSSGKEVEGTWDQTGMLDYHYTVNEFLEIPEGSFKESVEHLSVQDGFLVFGLGFLAIAMKKIEEGHITKEPDIGDIVPTPEEEAHKDIVGIYDVCMMMTFINDKFDLFTKEEIRKNCEKKKKAGEMDEDEIREMMSFFDAYYEFTDDHKIYRWSLLPAGVSEEEIKAAIEAGEINDVKDGYYNVGEALTWKYVKGDYYYDTGTHREVFDEVISPWDKLSFDENGLLPFGEGSVKLKKRQ